VWKSRRISPISKNRSQRLANYRVVRKEFLAGKRCACYGIIRVDSPTGRMIWCDNKASEVHHSRGRVGDLLCDTRYFVPVCRAAHDWIGCNLEEARKHGWIAEKGLWNTQ
jgi:hypothetical protein